MAFVRVEQRNAHLASAVKLGMVNGKDGQIAKAILTAISNVRVGIGEERAEEATSVQWTLWGKQAENAAEYLGRGSHVNIVGRVRNNNYTDADGREIYGLAFTVEEIDYLDSRSEVEARRVREGAVKVSPPAPTPASPANGRQRPTGRADKPAKSVGVNPDDIPF